MESRYCRFAHDALPVSICRVGMSCKKSITPGRRVIFHGFMIAVLKEV
jgi:hypothetical protein